MEVRPVTVLMVEDDPAHTEIIRRNFAQLNVDYHLVHLADGRAALDYLQKTADAKDAEHPLPDLILLDLRLPKVDGLEVLRTLKGTQGLRELPVVVLTTSTNGKDISRAYDLGANSYLVKPVGFRDFQEMMTALGGYWLKWNRYPR